jgi:5-formaminoimidazole-4-carboxamide-1-beta-D-ribofuranosyl 5'-monophosphate synthetase
MWLKIDIEILSIKPNLDGPQVAKISKEVLSNIAIVEVAETAKHEFGFFRCKSRRDFAEIVTLK